MNLRAARKKRGLTQQEVAKHIGVNQNTYSYWENGKTKIDNESLQKLADLFGATTDYLLGRTNEPNVSVAFLSEKSAKKDLPDDWEAGLTEEQLAALNAKDYKDVAYRITNLRDDLASQNELYLSGEILDDETRELLQAALENAVVISKIMAKQKFNPKKNK